MNKRIKNNVDDTLLDRVLRKEINIKDYENNPKQLDQLKQAALIAASEFKGQTFQKWYVQMKHTEEMGTITWVGGPKLEGRFFEPYELAEEIYQKYHWRPAIPVITYNTSEKACSEFFTTYRRGVKKYFLDTFVKEVSEKRQAFINEEFNKYVTQFLQKNNLKEAQRKARIRTDSERFTHKIDRKIDKWADNPLNTKQYFNWYEETQKIHEFAHSIIHDCYHGFNGYGKQYGLIMYEYCAYVYQQNQKKIWDFLKDKKAIDSRLADILMAFYVIPAEKKGAHDEKYYQKGGELKRLQEALADYAELYFNSPILSTKDQTMINKLIPSSVKRVFANVWNNRTKWEEERDDDAKAKGQKEEK